MWRGAEEQRTWQLTQRWLIGTSIGILAYIRKGCLCQRWHRLVVDFGGGDAVQVRGPCPAVVQSFVGMLRFWSGLWTDGSHRWLLLLLLPQRLRLKQTVAALCMAFEVGAWTLLLRG